MIDSVKNSKLSNYPTFRNNNFISIPRIWLFDWLWNWLGVRILKWSQIDFHFWRWFICMIFLGITGQIGKSKKKWTLVILLVDFYEKNNEFRTENRFNHHEMMIAIVFIFDNLRTHCVPWATFPKFETADL